MDVPGVPPLLHWVAQQGGHAGGALDFVLGVQGAGLERRKGGERMCSKVIHML